jgi:hypothetical protein
MQMKKIIFIAATLITAFLMSSNLTAQTDKKEKTIAPAVTTEYSHPFVKMLEDIELKYMKGKKHWRKGDYTPYEFIRCDVDGERARLSYKKEGSQMEFYLVYFEYFDGEWHFDFNDIAFQPKLQKNGSTTTLRDALRTKNKSYWFSKDNLAKEK